MSPSSYFVTFYINTELSPSAVIPAWANSRPFPTLLTDKYPWPPHLSRNTVARRLECHVMRGFIKQHRRTSSLGGDGLFDDACFKLSYWNLNLTYDKPRFNARRRATIGMIAFCWSWYSMIGDELKPSFPTPFRWRAYLIVLYTITLLQPIDIVDMQILPLSNLFAI